MDTVPLNNSSPPRSGSIPPLIQPDPLSAQIADLEHLRGEYEALSRLLAALVHEARRFQAHLERPDPRECVYGCHRTPAEHSAADAAEAADEARWRWGPERAEWLAERGQS